MLHPIVRNLLALAGLALALAPAGAFANAQQEKIAKAYVEASASGNPGELLPFFHPGELDDLRRRLLLIFENEANQGLSTLRGRLFGSAATLDEIRRLTPDNFYLTVARRVGLPGEPIGAVKVLGVVEENSQLSHAVVRIAPPTEKEGRSHVAIVSLIRYGKDWRVAIPDALQARVDAALAAGQGGQASNGPKVANPPEIMAALELGSAALRDGDCAGYYHDHMSPHFVQMTSPKALGTLIKQCQVRDELRETYISALELAKRLPPKFEQNGNRAVYDLRGQGLPFESFSLEKVEGEWYVAE